MNVNFTKLILACGHIAHTGDQWYSQWAFECLLFGHKIHFVVNLTGCCVKWKF